MAGSPSHQLLKSRLIPSTADSQIKHGVNPTHDYFVSALLSGVKLAYDRTQDAKYLEFIEKHVGQPYYSPIK
jgi:rhamnogalacturonyl hydrolase YesR